MRASSSAIDTPRFHPAGFGQGVVDALSAHIAVLDEGGTIVAVNRAWREFAAANDARCLDSVGTNYLHVCGTAKGACCADAAAVSEGIRRVLRGESPLFTHEYPCHSPTEKRWFVARVTPFGGAGPARAVVAHENITHRRLAEERLRELVRIDRLTGLLNRAGFLERLQDALGRWRGGSLANVAVAFLDFDRFKLINDTLGHDVGDELLRSIAERLRTGLGWEDAAARFGGDEFVLMLAGDAGEAEAVERLRRLLLELARPHALSRSVLTSTASAGIVARPRPGDDENAILRDADAAMYRAKEAGRGTYRVFDSAMRTALLERTALEADLRGADLDAQFRLVYQPIVDLSTGELDGFEALLRWRHPIRGDVPPARFVDLAEEVGLIVPLGEWTLRRACRQLAEWAGEDAGFARRFVSVNVAKRQLIEPSVVDAVRSALLASGLPASSLMLEVTESTVVDPRAEVGEVLRTLADQGVRLAMDDFGTGHSSLSSLHRLPVQVVKVDRAFVRELGGRREFAALVSAVVNLAQNLSLGVVAEGIEDEGQLATLQAVDCRWGQGYLLSPPLEAESVPEFVRRRRR